MQVKNVFVYKNHFFVKI